MVKYCYRKFYDATSYDYSMILQGNELACFCGRALEIWNTGLCKLLKKSYEFSKHHYVQYESSNHCPISYESCFSNRFSLNDHELTTWTNPGFLPGNFPECDIMLVE